MMGRRVWTQSSSWYNCVGIMEIFSYTQNNPNIETPRLVLRPLRKSDVLFMQEWLVDESIYKYWSKREKVIDRTPSLIFAHVETASKSIHWGIQYEDRVVGELWLYLNAVGSIGKIAYRVAPLYQRKGIATESICAIVDYCFTKSELELLWADVFVHNKISIHVLEKSGFHREKLVQQSKEGSSLFDYYIYSILNTYQHST